LRGKSVEQVLDDVHATVIYADPVLRLDPRFATFVSSPPSGWRTVAAGTGTDGDWSVLVRRQATL
jgi:hypothetical protein